MKLLLSFLFLLTLSCTHQETRVSKVQPFLTQWEQDYGPIDPHDLNQFKGYLLLTEGVYDQRELESKFDGFLIGLNNSSQLLSHSEFNMADKYCRERGRRPVLHSREFKRYKLSFLKYQETRLNKEREEKLLKEIGPEALAEIRKNYQIFRTQVKSDHIFPF